MSYSSTKQRLALFLDGTWNTEDDITKVLNAYHFTKEGLIPEENVIQKRYYDRGVGTSALDKITGGGLGYGLEKNVREAYNWLVDNYNGKEDQIYIFGFSRGAYTARSLVGLIAACGLIKRGAPMTTTQLWNGYAFISKNRDLREEEWWETELNKDKNKAFFRRLTELEGKEVDALFNNSEKLIQKWSRRVDINYLGIFDTVGALGIHALGIPGLRSKMDEHHNLNPTTLIKSCRHALAIDEHRTSFRLTPILDYVKNDETGSINFYDKIIKQRWFVGAHSNIGGGYSNNVLSMTPFLWVMKGAELAELKLLESCEIAPAMISEKPKEEDIRDSYAELFKWFGTHFLRVKRHFRPIGRADLVRVGSTLRTINEDIDDSVFELADEEGSNYAPPNLLAYLYQHPEKDKRKKSKGRQPQQQWPGEVLYSPDKNTLKTWLIPRTLLLLWSLLAAFGALNILQFFWVDAINFDASTLAILAGVLVLVDWGEARATMEITFHPRSVIPKAAWNVLYWIRLLAIPAFLVGLVCLITQRFDLAWRNDFSFSGLCGFAKAFTCESLQLKHAFPVLSTTVIILLLDFFGRKSFLNEKQATVEKIEPAKLTLNAKSAENHDGTKGDIQENGSTILARIAFVISLLIFGITLIELCKHQPVIAPDILSGKLLLIYLLLSIFAALFSWVGKPISKSGIYPGSISQLQNAYSPTIITSLFNGWVKKLSRTWTTPDDLKVLDKVCLAEAPRTTEQNHYILAWLRLKEVLRTALWRDLLGFIPGYSIVLGTILYIGSELYGCTDPNHAAYQLFGEVPIWLVLILVTALADVAENAIHLRYIHNHPRGGSSKLLVSMGVTATIIKFIGFFSAALIAVAIILFSAVEVLGNVGGWRCMLASAITYILIIALVLRAIAWFRNGDS